MSVERQTSESCREIALLLSCYHDGEVDERERQMVDQHLVACPICRHRLSEMNQVDRWVNGVFELSPARPVKVGDASSSNGRPGWVAIAAGVMAMAACLLFLAVWLPERGDELEPNQPGEAFVSDAMMLHAINRQSEQDQQDMIETLEMDLRALQLELRLAKVDPTENEQVQNRVDSLMERLNRVKTKQ